MSVLLVTSIDVAIVANNRKKKKERIEARTKPLKDVNGPQACEVSIEKRFERDSTIRIVIDRRTSIARLLSSSNMRSAGSPYFPEMEGAFTNTAYDRS